MVLFIDFAVYIQEKVFTKALAHTRRERRAKSLAALIKIQSTQK